MAYDLVNATIYSQYCESHKYKVDQKRQDIERSYNLYDHTYIKYRNGY